MLTDNFEYKRYTDTWFWIISAICLGGILVVLVFKGLTGNPTQFWKLVVVLSPLFFALITLIRIVIYRKEYQKEAGEILLMLDKETPKLTVQNGSNKKEILPSEIDHLKLFESYGNGPPFTEFTFMEIVLKTGESVIIPDRIANTNDLSLLLKGKRRIRKKRFMNRIKTTTNNSRNSALYVK